MKKRTDNTIYDKILIGAILLIAAEVLAPVPFLGPIIQIMGIVL